MMAKVLLSSILHSGLPILKKWYDYPVQAKKRGVLSHSSLSLTYPANSAFSIFLKTTAFCLKQPSQSTTISFRLVSLILLCSHMSKLE